MGLHGQALGFFSAHEITTRVKIRDWRIALLFVQQVAAAEEADTMTEAGMVMGRWPWVVIVYTSCRSVLVVVISETGS